VHGRWHDGRTENLANDRLFINPITYSLFAK